LNENPDELVSGKQVDGNRLQLLSNQWSLLSKTKADGTANIDEGALDLDFFNLSLGANESFTGSKQQTSSFTFPYSPSSLRFWVPRSGNSKRKVSDHGSSLSIRSVKLKPRFTFSLPSLCPGRTSPSLSLAQPADWTVPKVHGSCDEEAMITRRSSYSRTSL